MSNTLIELKQVGTNDVFRNLGGSTVAPPHTLQATKQQKSLGYRLPIQL